MRVCSRDAVIILCFRYTKLNESRKISSKFFLAFVRDGLIRGGDSRCMWSQLSSSRSTQLKALKLREYFEYKMTAGVTIENFLRHLATLESELAVLGVPPCEWAGANIKI